MLRLGLAPPTVHVGHMGDRVAKAGFEGFARPDHLQADRADNWHGGNLIVGAVVGSPVICRLPVCSMPDNPGGPCSHFDGKIARQQHEHLISLISRP